MSADERLLAGEATDFERKLLGSWQSRQPSPEAQARLLSRVGVVVGAATVATVATTVTTAKTAAGGSSIAPKAIAASSALVKWLAVGAVGVTVTASTIGYVHHVRAMDPTGSAAAIPAVAPAPAAIPAPTPAVNASPATIELGPTQTQAQSVPPVPAVTPKTKAAKSTLDEEVAMMARARQAEAAGDPATAIALLDAYDAKYPGGSLARESTEIRIQALVAQGNRPAAERLAERFIASHPSTLDVRNIRRALDPGPKP